MSLSQALNQFAQNLGRYRFARAGLSCIRMISMISKDLKKSQEIVRDCKSNIAQLM